MASASVIPAFRRARRAPVACRPARQRAGSGQRGASHQWRRDQPSSSSPSPGASVIAIHLPVGHQLRGDDSCATDAFHDSRHEGRRTHSVTVAIQQEPAARRSQPETEDERHGQPGRRDGCAGHGEGHHRAGDGGPSRRSVDRGFQPPAGRAPPRQSAAPTSRSCRQCPGAISDLTRLTPQASGNFRSPARTTARTTSTVDGSYFNRRVRSWRRPAWRQNRASRADLAGVDRAGAGQRRAATTSVRATSSAPR